MRHKERVKIARKIAKLIVKKYGKKVLLFGILGSTARNEDVSTSDMEMLCILKGKFNEKDVQFLHRGLFMHVWMESEKKIFNDVKKINVDWPLEEGHYLAIKIVYGDRKLPKKVLKTIKEIPEKKFIDVIEDNLPNIYERLGAIKSAIKRKGINLRNLDSLVKILVYHTAIILCLLNKQPVFGSNYRIFDEVYKLKKLPKDYKKDVEKLFYFESPKRLVKLSEEFVEKFIVFLRGEGIKLRDIKNLREIRW
jgi:hypothetical protein